MDHSNLINPYSLLGLKNTCNISELKQNYYNMSLLTHPDKGGSASDFQIVNSAYKYIKNQIEDIREVSYEELEQAFEDFCKAQENKKNPCFYEVYEETNDWLNEFNRRFEKDCKIDAINPLMKGYGDLLDKSEVKLEYDETDNCLETQNKFSRELLEYEEPNFLPDSITYFPLDEEDIMDFSNLSDNLKSADYQLTHSQVENLEKEIKNTGNHKTFRDCPTESIEYSTLLCRK